MTPGKLFNSIRKNRFFLLQHYSLEFAVYSSLLLLVSHLNLNHYHPGFLVTSLLVVAGVIKGLLAASFLHNTSHGNVPGKLFNRIVGEYAGAWTPYGYVNFTMVHVLHHKHSDEELDPVSPRGMSFLVFLFAPMRKIISCTKKHLFSFHGHHNDYHSVMNMQVVVFHLNMIAKFAFWYALLGKTLFFAFYLPGMASLIAVYAHINYVCHRDNGESVDILNLNHNLYYKVANFFTIGGYYHRNHHINMRSFNPQTLKGPRYGLYVITGQNQRKTDQSFVASSLARYFNLDVDWSKNQSISEA